MEQRTQGRDGLTVPALGYGCMGMSQGYARRRHQIDLFRTPRHGDISGFRGPLRPRYVSMSG